MPGSRVAKTYPDWLRRWPFICFSVQSQYKHKPVVTVMNTDRKFIEGLSYQIHYWLQKASCCVFLRYQQCAQLFYFFFVTDLLEHDLVV